MLVLLTILIFMFIPLVMLIIYLVRPQLGVQGFLAVLAVLAGLPLVLLARPEQSLAIAPFTWQPASLFSLSPSLLIDNTSWYFAVSLSVLALSAVFTSLLELGKSAKFARLALQDENHQAATGSFGNKDAAPVESELDPHPSFISTWPSWASILVVCSLGLVAVTAGNLLTLLLAWTAFDLAELFILLSQEKSSKTRERVILFFSGRVAGMVMVLLAGLFLWAQGADLSFSSITPTTSVYLVLAVGLRLGILPLRPAMRQRFPIHPSQEIFLRSTTAASSFILLVRISSIGISGLIAPYLIGFTALAGIFSSLKWLAAKNELDGRSYWFFTVSALVILSALLTLPVACIAWSITGLLSGGLIFSMSIRHRNLIPLAVLGILFLSAVPFSPTWQGETIYQYATSSTMGYLPFLAVALVISIIHSILLAGFIRHILREIIPMQNSNQTHVEKWVWFIYPVCLVIMILAHFSIGWLIYPETTAVHILSWIIGPLVLIIAALVYFIYFYYMLPIHPATKVSQPGIIDSFFSLAWLYGILWRLFRMTARGLALISNVLEGDGGIVWALVLFALLFIFIQK